jgi:hypothetical protein
VQPDAGSDAGTPVDEEDDTGGSRRTEPTGSNRRPGETNGDADGFVWGGELEGTVDEGGVPTDRDDPEEHDGRESGEGTERE